MRCFRPRDACFPDLYATSMFSFFSDFHMDPYILLIIALFRQFFKTFFHFNKLEFWLTVNYMSMCPVSVAMNIRYEKLASPPGGGLPVSHAR